MTELWRGKNRLIDPASQNPLGARVSLLTPFVYNLPLKAPSESPLVHQGCFQICRSSWHTRTCPKFKLVFEAIKRCRKIVHLNDTARWPSVKRAHLAHLSFKRMRQDNRKPAAIPVKRSTSKLGHVICHLRKQQQANTKTLWTSPH